MPATAAAGYREAITGADIVCACTHSPDPVVHGAWLEPGTHVTSVGVNGAGRELDAEAVARSLVVVESRSAALSPFPTGSNDLSWAIRDGAITADHVHAELGELVSGTRPGRTDSPADHALQVGRRRRPGRRRGGARALDRAGERAWHRGCDLKLLSIYHDPGMRDLPRKGRVGWA